MSYFKESEFNCNGKPCFEKMDKKFISKLEKARSFSSVPFIITSSWRSDKHNRDIGASATSSHLKGVAVDISAPFSSDKYKIIKALMNVFTRIGVGKDFIHADMDYDKAQNVIWTY